jgi:DNA-binding MarR family transcriptional regulator
LRQFLAFSETATQAAGVTSQQYQALLAIKARSGDGIIIREFADQMLLQHHSAVQLIDRLVGAGFMERRNSPSDRRKVLVVMTAKGEQLVGRLASNHIRGLLKPEPLLAESLKQLRQMGPMA